MGSPEKKIRKEGKNWQIKLMRRGRIKRGGEKRKALKKYKRKNRESRIGKQAKAIPGKPLSVPMRKSKQARKHIARKQYINSR